MNECNIGFNDFLSAYIECALWSTLDQSDENTGGNPLDKNYTRDDIAPETLQRITEDCKRFYDSMRDTWEGNYIGSASNEYTEAQLAGHDFWLTRNRHGAGFWDGNWSEEVSDQLDEVAHDSGEYDLYLGDDNKIYGFPSTWIPG